MLDNSNAHSPPNEVVWRYIPNSSQEFALRTRCHHTLFTGTRGPGKTDTQLMAFRYYVGAGYGPFWRGVIFDREYKNLDDLVLKSKRWFYKFKDGAQWLSSKSDYKWVWPTGEELLFRSFDKPDDYWNYHGQEFPFIGWNELCKYPTMAGYTRMMSCNRSSFMPYKDAPIDDKGNRVPMDPIPLKVFSTTNPFGVGHNWVKRRFIDAAPFGKIVRVTTAVFNPQTQRDETVTKTQVAIHGSYRENIFLSPEYIAELHANSNDNERKAWLNGDWDIVAGGAIDDVWDKRKHVIPRFKVPSSWLVDRSLDWGSTHPFSVGWWAEANGDEATLPDGTTFCPPPGTLIQLSEWYGTKEIGSNVGLKMSAPDIALGIIEREIELMAEGWVTTQPETGPADNQIRDVREVDVDTIEKKMADLGVRWDHSDKSPGSRKNGLQLIRDRLQASTRREGQGLYFMDNCRASIATLPVLPRDKKKFDDVDTEAEDHPYDMTRYRVLKGSNRYARKLKLVWPT